MTFPHHLNSISRHRRPLCFQTCRAWSELTNLIHACWFLFHGELYLFSHSNMGTQHVRLHSDAIINSQKHHFHHWSIGFSLRLSININHQNIVDDLQSCEKKNTHFTVVAVMFNTLLFKNCLKKQKQKCLKHLCFQINLNKSHLRFLRHV